MSISGARASPDDGSCISAIPGGSYDPGGIVKKEHGRFTHLKRCYRLAALLADGRSLDRNVVAAELSIGVANADRHIEVIQETMRVTKTRGKDGLTTIKAAATPSGARAARPTVVAACFGASLARLFRDTPFETRLRDVVGHVLAGIEDVPMFKERVRQFLFIPRGGERALRRNGATILDTIVDAMLRRRTLRVRHVRFRGEPEVLYMNPLSLALHEHQLYLLGYVDGGVRIVRFARISAALMLKQTFEYPSLDEYDPEKLFADSLGVFIHDDREKGIFVRDVRLRLSRRWASYVATHQWHTSQEQSVDELEVLVSFHLRTCPELERLILGFGPEAEVLEPADLRVKIAESARETAALYASKPVRKPRTVSGKRWATTTQTQRPRARSTGT
jgi:hypothetical protein